MISIPGGIGIEKADASDEIRGKTATTRGGGVGNDSVGDGAAETVGGVWYPVAPAVGGVFGAGGAVVVVVVDVGDSAVTVEAAWDRR